jgi:uncharacterized protein involved in exopolysaccharide biosynthesis
LDAAWEAEWLRQQNATLQTQVDVSKRTESQTSRDLRQMKSQLDADGRKYADLSRQHSHLLEE